jgi:hypothetical protein
MRVFPAALLVVFLLGSAGAAATEIRQADHLWQGENRLLVRLHLDLNLPEVLLEALANGVAVNFHSEVRLEYRRGILGERTLSETRQAVRLEYYALSRHYVITDLNGQRLEHAPTLGDALEVLARRLGRVLLAVEPEMLRPGLNYSLASRVVLDQMALPLPLQWDTRLRSAYVTKPGWYRWPLE